ncbi:MAG: response regulator [Bacteriovoracaceae bacterium]|nr:response regulator [Deltaproteobacteria bacterium]MDI9541564.1 response regulator [Pseudomonadota bacterium]NLW66790.1 response regulator [Bacteriovoracaceae bacterium]HRR20767.1 response regulator [Desulfomonilia bacterium]HPX49758.1 response regulator [Deltaproteobacteria bacterium]
MTLPKDDDERKVLVIDDDEGDCCLVEDILSEEGFHVVKAVGGEMGIRILSEEEFPVVITDLRMPDVDGLAVIDFVRKRRMESLIVVITGFASVNSVIEALRLGAYDYILKPFGADLLKFTVQRAFDYIALRDEKDRLKFFEVVTQLASTTAHEVFQPLTVLMGETKGILRTSDDASVREMAEHILEEARKIRDIIRKMDNLNGYVIKTFPGGHSIIDIEKGSSGRTNIE